MGALGRPRGAGARGFEPGGVAGDDPNGQAVSEEAGDKLAADLAGGVVTTIIKAPIWKWKSSSVSRSDLTEWDIRFQIGRSGVGFLVSYGDHRDPQKSWTRSATARRSWPPRR